MVDTNKINLPHDVSYLSLRLRWKGSLVWLGLCGKDDILPAFLWLPVLTRAEVGLRLHPA
jgi:hypothetical protein